MIHVGVCGAVGMSQAQMVKMFEYGLSPFLLTTLYLKLYEDPVCTVLKMYDVISGRCLPSQMT